VSWTLQGKYTARHGWEDLSEYDDEAEAQHDLRAYEENEPQYPHRLIETPIAELEDLLQPVGSSRAGIVDEFTTLVGQLRRMGVLEADELALEEGQPRNGISWGLFQKMEHGGMRGVTGQGMGRGFLGKSKEEAYNALHLITVVIQRSADRVTDPNPKALPEWDAKADRNRHIEQTLPGFDFCPDCTPVGRCAKHTLP
jgi:hypothetical protein